MSTKDLSKLSAQELMALAKNQLKEDKSDLKKLSIIRQFIISDGIKQGDYNIPAILIYDRYRKWCKVNNSSPLSLSKFFSDFKLYFKKIRLTKGMGYQMSPAGFDLSDEYLQEVNKKYLKKRTSYGKTKKEKQKEEDKKNVF